MQTFDIFNMFTPQQRKSYISNDFWTQVVTPCGEPAFDLHTFDILPFVNVFARGNLSVHRKDISQQQQEIEKVFLSPEETVCRQPAFRL